ncbi:Peptidyl-prolyl cis-trans isomerase [Diplonema papillatum]|nr:Peptidyl-prolyl cis-trans isomerase [Diplonema papillatum]
MAALMMRRALLGVGGVAAGGFVGATFFQAGAASYAPPCPTNSENSVCKLNVTIDGSEAGTIEVELFDDVVPKTARNFRVLCAGNEAYKAWASAEQKAGSMWSGSMPFMSFDRSPIHRIIPGFMIQAGDFTSGDGRGGMSIYGARFADESFEGKAGKHHRGSLSMANAGRNTNGSQFFITFESTPWLNGKHVVFGQVLSGIDVVDKLEQAGSRSGQTKVPCTISSAQVVKGPTGQLTPCAKGEKLSS